MTEANGKQLLRAHLVPKSAMEGDDAGGVPQLDVSMESNLDPIFLPEHVDSAAKVCALILSHSPLVTPSEY
jgi:hypothetical protein